jgi:tRNA G18 (ribose-2'-O)-methylase SpoU
VSHAIGAAGEVGREGFEASDKEVIQIVTAGDPRVADYRDLRDAELIRTRGQFVAEGRLLVRRLFETKAFPVRSVLVTPVALRAMEDVIDADRCPIYVCEQRIMDDLAGFNFHRGCLALGERPTAIEPIDRLARACCLLALEGVGNPDNVGGLFRAAAALGGSGVLLDQKCADPLYRKAIRTSMGAVFCLPFSIADDWLSTIRMLRDGGAEVIALTPDPAKTPRGTGARPLAGSAPRPLAWSRRTRLSNEARGCDRPHEFPFRGRRLLNVVVAAGIALAALARPTRSAAEFFSIAVARSTSAVNALMAPVTTGTNDFASSHWFCSMPSRIPGSVLTPYPV